MKAILAFGQFGGPKSERIVIPTAALAAQIAASVAHVESADEDTGTPPESAIKHFTVSRSKPRVTWEDRMKTRWVSVTAIL